PGPHGLHAPENRRPPRVHEVREQRRSPSLCLGAQDLLCVVIHRVDVNPVNARHCAAPSLPVSLCVRDVATTRRRPLPSAPYDIVAQIVRQGPETARGSRNGYGCARKSIRSFLSELVLEVDGTLAVVGQVRKECRAYGPSSLLVAVHWTGMIPGRVPDLTNHR